MMVWSMDGAEVTLVGYWFKCNKRFLLFRLQDKQSETGSGLRRDEDNDGNGMDGGCYSEVYMASTWFVISATLHFQQYYNLSSTATGDNWVVTGQIYNWLQPL